jgi:ABC-type transport system involved in multi-copper enzyme maturation permease subunit
MHVGTGPVFAYERITAARRWSLYAGRSFLVASLLLVMAITAATRASYAPVNSQGYAKLGEAYFYALISVELAIVMLAAPAATAGAICLDRARGNLAHMLVTDLSDSEIVLGKLAARLLPVLGLVACSWPVMAISSLLGGIDPVALTLAFAVILAMALLGCTLALALSVWARKTHEVLLATYTVLGLSLLIYPIWLGLTRSGVIPRPPREMLYANAVYVAFVPYWAPNTSSIEDYALFFGGTLASSIVLTGLAVWRMRPASLREAGRGAGSDRLGLIGRLVRFLPGPAIDANPVLWREWHRSRPSPWMLILGVLGIGTTTACCIAGAVAMFFEDVEPGRGSVVKFAGVYGYMLQVVFGLLMFSVMAPTALAEERQRGTLDILMTTTLSTRTIVLGKWWGTFRIVPLLALGPTLMAIGMAYGPRSGGTAFPAQEGLSLAQRTHGILVMPATLLSHGALLTSIGLAAATWIRRPYRAMAISVIAYVLIAVGWPICYFVAVQGGRPWDPLPCLSPIFAAGSLADALTIRGNSFAAVFWGATVFDALVFAAAMALREMTVHTFETCLGRMPEGSLGADAKKTPPVDDAEWIGEWEPS